MNRLIDSIKGRL